MKHYNLGDIDNIPATGEPLGPELIAQLEKLGTNISEKMNLLDFKSNNGNTVLWGPLDEEKDGNILDFFKFHSAFTYVMGRGITQEEVDKYDEYICRLESKKKKAEVEKNPVAVEKPKKKVRKTNGTKLSS